MKKFLAPLIILLLLISCSEPQTHAIEQENAVPSDVNPAAPGFNKAGSDSLAIDIADKVMIAMGGRQIWEEIETLDWTFFGRRKLHWNKQTGDVDILMMKDSTEIHVNLNDMQGQVMLKENPSLSADSIATWMEYGRSIWINDSYWLIMPFKLKDSGVTLKYLRKEFLNNQVESHVLELTFQDIGDTPENKYEVFVDVNSHLVNQWSFFNNYTDTIPAFTIPWTDYQNYEGIQLSSHRGDNALTGIAVTIAAFNSSKN